ncbi:MAG: DUF4230 domain-containing protein [Dysgonamonadaceae bacterium]
MTKKIRTVALLIVVAIALLLLAGYIYNTFFRTNYVAGNNTIGPLIIGLFIGGIIAFLIFKLINANKIESGIRTESHTVVESIKRVFKIVVAEGQLNDIYNYESTKKLLKFIPSTKKALVIIKAKVLIGYDVEKCKWSIDENNNTITILRFPKPEIISIDPEFNYYYFEDDLFNFIGRKDLQRIQELGKEQVRNVALRSGLMNVASDQMKLLLQEVVNINHWKINNLQLVDSALKETPDSHPHSFESINVPQLEDENETEIKKNIQE